MPANAALRTNEPELLIDLERDANGRLALARVEDESQPVLVREILGIPDASAVAKACAPFGGQPSWLLGARQIRGKAHLVSRWRVGVSLFELMTRTSDRSEGLPLHVATTIAAQALEKTREAREEATRRGISPEFCSLNADALWLTPDGQLHLSEAGLADWLAGARAGGLSGPGPQPPWAVAQTMMLGLARPELESPGKREWAVSDLLGPAEHVAADPMDRLLERLRREPKASPDELSHWTRLLCGDRLMERQALNSTPNPGLSLIDCKTSLFHYSDVEPDLNGETPPRGGPAVHAKVVEDVAATRLALRDPSRAHHDTELRSDGWPPYTQNAGEHPARRSGARDSLLAWLAGAVLLVVAVCAAYGLRP